MTWSSRAWDVILHPGQLEHAGMIWPLGARAHRARRAAQAILAIQAPCTERSGPIFPGGYSSHPGWVQCKARAKKAGLAEL